MHTAGTRSEVCTRPSKGDGQRGQPLRTGVGGDRGHGENGTYPSSAVSSSSSWRVDWGRLRDWNDLLTFVSTTGFLT